MYPTGLGGKNTTANAKQQFSKLPKQTEWMKDWTFSNCTFDFANLFVKTNTNKNTEKLNLKSNHNLNKIYIYIAYIHPSRNL